jgi:hypothetical protein
LEIFNKSADKAIVSIEEMIATMRAISKDKVAYTESGDLQKSDMQKGKDAMGLYRHGVHEFSTMSDESLDKVQAFLGDSRVLTAAQEADKMRGRFAALGKSAPELKEISESWLVEGNMAGIGVLLGGGAWALCYASMVVIELHAKASVVCS